MTVFDKFIEELSKKDFSNFTPSYQVTIPTKEELDNHLSRLETRLESIENMKKSSPDVLATMIFK